MFDLKQMKQRY